MRGRKERGTEGGSVGGEGRKEGLKGISGRGRKERGTEGGSVGGEGRKEGLKGDQWEGEEGKRD